MKKDVNHEKEIKDLLEIEDRYKLLLQNLNCITYQIDPKSSNPPILDGNVFKITGYLPEEFTSGKIFWFEIIYKDDLEKVKDGSEKMLNIENYVADTEYRIIHKGGEIKWIRDIAKKVTDDSRLNETIQGILYDITGNKTIEGELRESEERYKAFFNNNYIITLIIDPATSQILDANPAACEFYGWSLSETTKKKISEINTLSPEEIFYEMENARQQKRNHFYFKHRLANGKIRDVEVFSGPIIIKGKQVLYSVIKDITESKQIEESLIQMQLSIEKARDSIYWIIADARIVYANESACNSLEYSKDELLNLTIFDIDPNFNREDWASHWEKVRELQPNKIETYHKTKSGKVFPVEISIDFITFGEIEYHVIFSRDITSRKQAEEALEKYKNLLSTSQSVAHLGSWEMYIPTKELYWSDETFRIFGIDNHSFEPTIENFLELLIKEDRDPTIAHLKETLKTKIFKDLKYRVVKPDGTISWVLNTGQVYLDDNGNPIKMVGTVQDITERTIIEQELRNSEDKFSKAFHTSPDSININRLIDGIFLDINDGFTQLTGYTKEEVIGKSSFDINLWADPRDRITLTENLKEKGEMKNLETGFRLKSGIVKTGLMSARIIEIGGEKCILSITRDISERKYAEDALRDSQEKYYQLFELGLEAIFLIDNSTGSLLEANSAATQMYGYSHEELLTMRNEDLSAEPEKTQNVTKSSTFGSVIVPLRFHKRKDGKVFPVEITGRFFKWKGQDVHVAAIRDITERRNAEEALRESEERFHLMFKNNGAVMFLVEPETKQIIDANNAASAFYGFSHENLCLMTINDINIFTPEEVTKEKELAQKDKRNYLTLKHRLANGEIRTVETYSSPFTVNGKTFIFNIIHDITERDKAENELRLRSAALEAAANAIVITDNRGNVLWANNAFTKLTGYEFEEAVGKNLRILKSGSHGSDYYNRMWETITAGKIWYEIIINKRKDGALYTEDQTIAPVRDKDGKISHFIAIKQDITQRKKSEEELVEAKEKAEISEKLKSAFLAQMSHEIRSPLYRILGYVSLIKDFVTTGNIEDIKEIKEYFNSIDLSSQRLTRTIDSILNMSELQTQSYSPTFTQVNLSDLMKRLHLEYLLQANLKHLDFKIVCSTRNPIIQCDEYSVTQIFANLIDNSLKYTESGEVKVVIERDKEKQIFVEVSDSGIGISKEFMKVLFSPFTQEETGYTRKFDGNGLGLALVKSYCDLNNAMVDVKSKKGKGTVFRVTFKDNF